MDGQVQDLVSLAQLRAIQQSSQEGYTFLLGDGETEIQLTYAQLDQQAKRVAAWLQHHQVAPGERILLLFPPGIDYIVAFWGCLYAGNVAVPIYPPRRTRINRFAQRFYSVIEDAQATAALTTASLHSLIDEVLSRYPGQQSFQVFDTDTIPDDISWQEMDRSAATIAMIQYTSGTTAMPKGVVLSHGNLLHNLRTIYHAFGSTSESSGVIWLPPYHDMGLIGGILQPLYGGFPVTLMAPATFLQSPFRWLELISRKRATISGGPNFAYDLCAQKISPAQRAQLDLSCWEVAFNGAEPIRHTTITDFAAAFASTGFRQEAFYPCYGLAEATLMVTGKRAGTAPLLGHFSTYALTKHEAVPVAIPDDNTRTLVGCGQSISEQEIVIVDPQTHQRQPEQQIGEIWVEGPSVAQGYWKKPLETREVFQATTDNETKLFLRTGDLGFFSAGTLYVTGRLKDLIIIRGRNYYPQDIEFTAGRCHMGLIPGNGAAFPVTVDGEERLVIIHELERSHQHADLTPILQAITHAIYLEHELQPYAVVLIRTGNLPRTTSGKVQRSLCRDLYLQGELHIVGETANRSSEMPDRNLSRDSLLQAPTELRLLLIVDYLQTQIARILKHEIKAELPGESLIALGLDSLQCAELTYRLQRDLQLDISIESLLDASSVEQLAHTILSQVIEVKTVSEGTHLELRAELRTEPASEEEQGLSYGEQALWFLQHALPDDHTYTIVRAVRLGSSTDLSLLEKSVHMLFARHKALTTIFPLHDGKPVRHYILPSTTYFEIINTATWREEQINHYLEVATRYTFDLERGPLCKIVLLTDTGKGPVLLFIAHHIIIDVWSLAILVEELGTLYTGLAADTPELPPLPASYPDFVRWQVKRLQGKQGTQLQSYWQQQLSALPPALDLPLAAPRQSAQSNEAGTERITIDALLLTQIKEFCRQQNVTPAMFFLTAFATLLHRYTQQQDLLIGTPFFGRNHPSLARLVGYLVNILPLRIDLSGQPSFLTLLQRVKQTFLSAIAHQDYPFSLLAHDQQGAGTLNHSSLEQIMFVMQNVDSLTEHALAPLVLGHAGSEIALGQLGIEPMQINASSAQRDLSLRMAEHQGQLLAHLEYNCSLLPAQTMQRMLANLTTLVQAALACPHSKLMDLAFIAPEELRLLHLWNEHTEQPARHHICLHRLFSAQAYVNPDAIAVVYEGYTLSYGLIEQRANQLAHFLQARGIGPDMLVGLCVERTPELIIGILGILKAGGAYLPLDPDTPEKRLAFMMNDTQLSILLTQSPLLARLSTITGTQIVCLDTNWPEIAMMPMTTPHSDVMVDNLAYVIYTSGSTGQPKGVMITHDDVIRLLTATWACFAFGPTDTWTLFHSYAFDFSVWEIWGALAYGGRLVIVPYWLSRSPEVFAGLVAEQGVTVLNQTPSAFQQFVEQEERGEITHTLRLIIFGGEALDSALPRRWFVRHDDQQTQLINMYGITETTVHVTYQLLQKAALQNESASVIGRPISDLQVYILDGQQQLLPIGSIGELYVGGAGLARGYLQRPELTAERFIPHPFSTRPGERLYRTGDLARYCADGSIEYLGRIDQQVKIRGFRIELGEIETVLCEHPAIQKSAVIAREDTPGHKYLAAYYTVAPSQAQPAIHDLRALLSRRLPSYMLPTTFMLLESFPLTINGKIDRRALPLPRFRSDREDEYAPPRSPAEATMITIWQNVLGKEPIGIDDNFFELGGDSILSIQIIAQAQSAGLACTIQQLFLYQSVRQLIDHLQEVAGETLPALHTAPTSQAPFSLLSAADRARLPMEQIVDAYPLTMLQAGLVFHSQFSRDYQLYVTSLHLALPFQQALFMQALNFLVARHEMLRTRFDLSNFSEAIQLVHARAESALEVYDLRDLVPEQQERVITEWIEQAKRRSFSWEELPFVRFYVHLRTAQTIQLTLSEPFFDGWSVACLLTELLKCYSKLLQQRVLPAAEPLMTAFRDYVQAERQQLASDDCQRYWQQSLQDATIHTLPHASRIEQEEHQIYRFVVPISSELSEQLKQVALRNKLPLKSVLLAAHLKVLSLLYGSSDVITGVIFNGRIEQSDGERVLGLFLNALPLRVCTSVSTWLELARRALEAEQSILPYRRYPIAQIQQQMGGQKLFEAVFNFTHFHAYQPLEQLEQIEVLGGYASEQTYFPLTAQCNVDHASSQIRVELDYNTSFLTEQQVATIADYYLHALQDLAAHPQSRPNNATLLSAQECTHLLHIWNRTSNAVTPTGNVLAWFEHQVEQGPTRIALICGDEKLTYQQLYQRACHLAYVLQQHQIGPESCVGVCLTRSCELIVALLGILLAGGAYVPLDPTYPIERLAFMLQDAGIALVITQEHLLNRLPHELTGVILLNPHDIPGVATPTPVEQLRPEHLSHIIYTSGSTGLPKGVEITRGSVSTFIHWALTTFTENQLAYVLASTSVSFDLSVFEIFVPLSSGGTVVLVQDALHLLAIAQTQPLSLINTVPSVLTEILREQPLPASVQVVNLAGEPLPRQLAATLYQQEAVQEIYNLYGPSEDTTYSTYARISRTSPLDPPIGRPISGTCVYVLDDQMQIVPVGVPGELYIGGKGLARGYRHRPELTALRFVPDPFANSSGSRLYRTGDLVRYREDGQLEYLQRLDHQVKIRGFRIELSEIEAALTEHATVREAVVIVREEVAGQKRLTAYLTLQPGQEITPAALRDFLKQRLPQYMLPADFVVLDTFPVTLNGKIDRHALQTLQVTFTQATAPFVAPETPTQKVVSQIWAEVLQLPAIGLYDSFFALGGHSLSATQAVSRLRAHFCVELSMEAFFQASTLKDLADMLEQLQSTLMEDDLMSIVTHIQTLSDEEVALMLLEREITLNTGDGSGNVYEKS